MPRMLLWLLGAVAVVASSGGAIVPQVLDTSSFQSTARGSDDVWVVLEHGDTEPPQAWAERWSAFAGSLGRCHTGTLAVAKGADDAELPAIRVLTKRTGEGTTLAAGGASPPALKKLRKALKKALAGCRKNSAGRFLKLDFARAGSSANTCSTAHDHLFFAIRSQPVAHEVRMAARLEAELRGRGVSKNSIARLDTIISSWVDFETSGPPFHVDYWVLKPWLPALLKQAPKSARWFVFVEPVTLVDVERLEMVLGALPHGEKRFIGRAITDEYGSIVHAYSSGEKYVFPKPGFALSRGLVEAAVADIESNKLPVDTHIEIFFEFSRWMAKLGAPVEDRADVFCAAPLPPQEPVALGAMAKKDAPFPSVTSVLEAASEPGLAKSCATAISPGGVEPFRERFELDANEVIVAVKTTKMFHADRLEIIRQTWGGDSAPIEIVNLSDFEEPSNAPVPTVDLTKEWGKVVNQKKGHCAKTDAILKHFAKHFGSRKWFVIADDDTWFNLPRLLEVLRSLDPSKPIYLGERYGYAHNGQGMGPYDYVTMGGGVALSKAALRARNECTECTCITPDTYDDMQMGKWFTARLGVAAVHEEGFHQAAPEHYHPLRLAHEELLSFHKFVRQDPPNDRKLDIAKTVARYAKELITNPSLEQMRAKSS